MTRIEQEVDGLRKGQMNNAPLASTSGTSTTAAGSTTGSSGSSSVFAGIFAFLREGRVYDDRMTSGACRDRGVQERAGECVLLVNLRIHEVTTNLEHS